MGCGNQVLFNAQKWQPCFDFFRAICPRHFFCHFFSVVFGHTKTGTQKTNGWICFLCFFTLHGKQNKFVRSFRFLGESIVRQSVFRFYYNFKRLILRYHIYCELIYCPIHHFHVYLILSNKMLIFLSLSSLLSSNFFEMSWKSLNIIKRGWYTSSNSF